jgi:hypothetical protein
VRTSASLLYDDARVRALLDWERIGPETEVDRVCRRGVFVALGGNITRVWVDGAYGADLELEEPGPWFADFQERRLVTGPGGPWVMWWPGSQGPAGPLSHLAGVKGWRP